MTSSKAKLPETPDVLDLFHPKDTSRSLPIALLRAREAVMSHFRPILHKHGITEQQWRVIRVLAEHSELEVSEVAKLAFVLGPSLSRIVRTLEARKLIGKRRDDADGRKYWLSITDTGTKLIHMVMPDSHRVYADLENKLGKKRLETLIKLANEVTALTAIQP
ncbi:MAG: homoprotocatechuate degradation operon regulator HpaR [Fimbriimonadaceae bacterium]|nr:homoprotocatechuate degradation operon regulator HpaR [Alphaproteobacteria bacterium]